MLGDMHANIGNDISGNQKFLYLGTRNFYIWEPENFISGNQKILKNIVKKIDP